MMSSSEWEATEPRPSEDSIRRWYRDTGEREESLPNSTRRGREMIGLLLEQLTTTRESLASFDQVLTDTEAERDRLLNLTREAPHSGWCQSRSGYDFNPPCNCWKRRVRV